MILTTVTTVAVAVTPTVGLGVLVAKGVVWWRARAVRLEAERAAAEAARVAAAVAMAQRHADEKADRERIAREIATVGAGIDALHGKIDEVRDDITIVRDRISHLEGAHAEHRAALAVVK